MLDKILAFIAERLKLVPIERGSNAYWTWEKYIDGRLVMTYKNENIGQLPSSGWKPWGSLYFYTLTLPDFKFPVETFGTHPVLTALAADTDWFIPLVKLEHSPSQALSATVIKPSSGAITGPINFSATFEGNWK